MGPLKAFGAVFCFAQLVYSIATTYKVDADMWCARILCARALVGTRGIVFGRFVVAAGDNEVSLDAFGG